MVQFNLPVPPKHKGDQPGMCSVAVNATSIMFAGSRNLNLQHNTCLLCLFIFANLGFSFYIGCAKGVDQAFRKALAQSPYYKKGFVACAFKDRTSLQHTYGLYAQLVVPADLHPKAALHKRTLWMVQKSAMLFLFPDDPVTSRWGKGSTLAFNSALLNLKPVFVSTQHDIPRSTRYKIIPGCFCGEIPGYWVLPYSTYTGGDFKNEYQEI